MSRVVAISRWAISLTASSSLKLPTLCGNIIVEQRVGLTCDALRSVMSGSHLHCTGRWCTQHRHHCSVLTENFVLGVRFGSYYELLSRLSTAADGSSLARFRLFAFAITSQRCCATPLLSRFMICQIHYVVSYASFQDLWMSAWFVINA